MRKRCLIYPRVSTEDQLDGYSIQHQLEKCRQYAQQKGWVVVGEYVESYTGKEYIRPEMTRMKDDIKRGIADAVIIYDVDRLSRNVAYFLQLENDLTNLGVEVYYARVDYANTPEGALMKHVTASIAQYERTKILERTIAGKRGRAKAGYPMPGFHDPYGYRYVTENTHQGRFEIVEEEAEVVRMVYQLCAIDHLSLVGISKKLSGMGIKSRGTNWKKRHPVDFWGTSTIWKILKNPTYKGEFWWGPADPILIPVPPIVDGELWQEAQSALAANKTNAKRNVKHEYLMRNRLYCTKCGGPFYAEGRSSMKYSRTDYYGCRGQHASAYPLGPVCKRKLRQVDIDELVWGTVVSAIRDDDYNPPVVSNPAVRKMRQECEQADAAIASLTEQYGKLIDLFSIGGIDKTVLGQRLQDKQQEIDKERERKAKLERKLEEERVSELRKQNAANYVNEIRDKLDVLTFEQRRKAIEYMDVRAYVTRGETADDDHVEVVIHILV